MHNLNQQLPLQHAQDMLRTAEHDRLIAQATATQPGIADRAAFAVGDTLVGVGQHLEQWARQRRMRRVRTRLHAV
jgi:hypothetical protein